MSRSYLEDCFAHWLNDVKAPPYERQYKFHPERKWKADFAWPDEKIIVEVEGLQGRHQFTGGFIRDCEKHRDAQRLGWIVYRVPGNWIGRLRGDGTVYLIRDKEVMPALADLFNLRRADTRGRWRL